MRARYIKQLNMSLSPLGFGVMRVPMRPDGAFSAEVHGLLSEAYERGVNYFDTAFPYLDGRSEGLLRDAIVSRYPRDSFYIADKLPIWNCGSRDDIGRIFNTQLERLGVEYIDFYLLHALNRARWPDICGKGVIDFLDKKRAEGKIRKVGFSFHDTADALGPILDAYDWDFAMIQINYYDWVAQRTKDSYDILERRGIPCMVMEPVGGGRLAELPESAEKLLKNVRPDDSAASWAIRFAANLPNVAVTLSGMCNRAQLDDNLSVFDPITPFSERELAALGCVVQILSGNNTIPCTFCGYCADDCPKNVDIQHIFKRYNDYMQFDNMTRFDLDYYMFFPQHRRASNCIRCDKCVEKCPQKIDVWQKLELINKAAAELCLGVDIDALKETLGGGSLLVCFGSGTTGRRALTALQECGLRPNYFCDDEEQKWGTEIGDVEVISPARLQELNHTQKLHVLITCKSHDEIKTQLDLLGITAVAPKLT